MSITQNIEAIRGRIAQAAVRSGRKPEDVLLIAVTKLHEPDEIEEAIAAGVTEIAEHKVQEIQKKFDQIHSPVNWHLIGHLQTNKVKYIIDKVVMIHSVDSVHLAQEIDKRAAAAGKTMDVLLQVNAAHEESKFGLDPKDVPQVFREILDSCPKDPRADAHRAVVGGSGGDPSVFQRSQRPVRYAGGSGASQRGLQISVHGDEPRF